MLLSGDDGFFVTHIYLALVFVVCVWIFGATEPPFASTRLIELL